MAGSLPAARLEPSRPIDRGTWRRSRWRRGLRSREGDNRDEVRSDIANFRPFDGVGADDGHVVFAEKFEEFWNGKAGVANFDGVTQLVMVIHIFERNPFAHPFIMV